MIMPETIRILSLDGATGSRKHVIQSIHSLLQPQVVKIFHLQGVF